MTVLRELLRIKEFREGQAETEVRRRRGRLDELVQALHRIERELEEFRLWSAEHERDLVADVCSRIVKLRELERLRARLAELRSREHGLEQEVDAAERQRRQATRELDEAMMRLRKAGRQKNKFTELARIYSEEMKRELELREELELEEFRSGDDDDWEQDADEPESRIN